MNKLIVRVKPGKRENRIISSNNNELVVEIAAPPVDGRANIELLKFLSKHFKKKFRIVSGHNSRIKILEEI
ncbi:YggU family protein [Candidatus Woesearchaeota archaeon]|nr:YggU family protein [Candidatus Woesearchaeota archaeon]